MHPGRSNGLYYGGDQGGTKYSPLTDVTSDNLQRLRIAWQWKHFDVPLEQYKTVPGQFESGAVDD